MKKHIIFEDWNHCTNENFHEKTMTIINICLWLNTKEKDMSRELIYVSLCADYSLERLIYLQVINQNGCKIEFFVDFFCCLGLVPLIVIIIIIVVVVVVRFLFYYDYQQHA